MSADSRVGGDRTVTAMFTAMFSFESPPCARRVRRSRPSNLHMFQDPTVLVLRTVSLVLHHASGPA